MPNAYGSVHQSLISFSLCPYCAPLQVSGYCASSLHRSKCQGVCCRVGDLNHPSQEWGCTRGSPLSCDFRPALTTATTATMFVMNSLMDTVSQQLDLSYQSSNPDTCPVANSPATWHYLLSRESELRRYT